MCAIRDSVLLCVRVRAFARHAMLTSAAPAITSRKHKRAKAGSGNTNEAWYATCDVRVLNVWYVQRSTVRVSTALRKQIN